MTTSTPTPLADLVADELRRLGVEVRTRKGFFDPGSAPLVTLRNAGRDLDLSNGPAGRCGDRHGPIVATCDRVAILEYQDGEREAVGIGRVLVDPDVIRFMDVDPRRAFTHWSIGTDGESKARGRAHSVQAKKKAPATAEAS
jgi:hypothetical protein